MTPRQSRVPTIFIITLIAPAAFGTCVLPDTLTVGLSVWISTSSSTVLAPGSATLTGDGSLCTLYTVTGTISIAQDSPPLSYTMTDSRFGGELVFSVEAPAQQGCCYSAALQASGGGFSGSSSQSGGCWYLPPPPPPPPPSDPCEGQAGDWQCSPILVNLSDGPWRLSTSDDPVLFDVDADGTAERITWTGRGEPLAFLALDRNSNGVVDDGAELFGTGTPLTSGSRAPNGFEALKELDTNHDGVIDPRDRVWRDLLLWTDVNHDGKSQSGELHPVAQSRIAVLHTAYQEVGRHDPASNAFRYMSLLAIEHGQRTYYDVYFRIVR